MKKASSHLRQQAERHVELPDIDISTLSADDIQSLIHNFEVHRVELELQNEELQRANLNADDAKRKYQDLFEFAPVGYLILDTQYVVLDANRLFARFVGLETPQLVNRAFTDFICSNFQDDWHLAIQHIARTHEAQTAELRLIPCSGNILWVRTEINSRDKGQTYLVSVSDITQQKQAEQEIVTLNRRIEASIIAGDMAWWEMELPSGAIVFNENKAAMLGFPSERFTHYQDFTNLLHPEDYDATMDACSRHIRGEAALYDCEYRIRKHDGSYAWFHDVGRIIERDQDRVKLVGIVTNITARKQAEQQLHEALAEKEVLLKEVHHRVKNNMQTIASLLYKQQQFIDDPRTRTVLDDSIHRVKSMAMIHEQIYRTKNLARINLAEYLKSLTTTLFRTYKPKGRAVTMAVDVDEVYLPIDTAIPLALIVNEVLTNALKYAFPDEQEGKLRITGRRESADMILSVSDNGIGLPEDFHIQHVNSLGLYLVHNLAVKQLGGTLNIDGSGGTEITIAFSLEKTV